MIIYQFFGEIKFFHSKETKTVQMSPHIADCLEKHLVFRQLENCLMKCFIQLEKFFDILMLSRPDLIGNINSNALLSKLIRTKALSRTFFLLYLWKVFYQATGWLMQSRRWQKDFIRSCSNDDMSNARIEDSGVFPV